MDIDPANISKLVNVDYPIVGDVKIVLNRLLEGLRDRVNQIDIVTGEIFKEI